MPIKGLMRRLRKQLRDQEEAVFRMRSAVSETERLLVEEVCREYGCVFVQAGWMGILYPWFYRPHDPRESDEEKKKRIKMFNDVLDVLPPRRVP